MLMRTVPPSPRQPHVHNMDGFFFCKLKVEPRQAKAEFAAAQAKGEAELADAGNGEGLQATAFDDDEDAARIQNAQKKRSSRKT